ncbi:hypothetical protein BN59_01540 [Legionella massiliensis]|uniref:Uncharacterized protein n=1 Tax=Legionella massiliensis TaxID=1034943 RepID=A0A078KZQ0_9GAMM|nr:hypothetical protein [Legionella massiliensis]CDZ77258.1 hypothetical protein BN59_01540 [Legionella massiliensis]CEE12996.1 hypothetical protein BN1094_01540 [Legionella massiliensis]
MRNYKYFDQQKANFDKSDYTPTSEELKSNKKLRQLVFSILFEDKFDFINDEILVDSDYFKEKLLEVEDYIATTYRNESEEFRLRKIDCIEFLICQMISLRLLKEVRYRGIQFPYEKIDKKSANSDFKALEKRLLSKNKRVLKFDKAFPQSSEGKSVSSRFMQEHRYRVSSGVHKNKRNDEPRSPVSAWQEDNLAAIFCGELRQLAMNARKRKHSKTLQATELSLEKYHFEGLQMQLSPAAVRYKLMRKLGATQFHLLYVGELIKFLKQLDFSKSSPLRKAILAFLPGKLIIQVH